MLNIFNNIYSLESECENDEDQGEDITQINLPYLTEFIFRKFSNIHKMISPSKILKLTTNNFKFETMKLHIYRFLNLRYLKIYEVSDGFDC